MNKIKVSVDFLGFPTAEFRDFYNKRCLVEISSIADERCIWLGLKSADPKIMAKNAEKLGVITDKKVGWIDYEIPSEVLLSTKMHLSQDQVKALLPILKKFAKTGELS